MLVTAILCDLAGWPGIFISMISFLFFTDMCIYWIHRFLHHKLIYKVSERIKDLPAGSGYVGGGGVFCLDASPPPHTGIKSSGEIKGCNPTRMLR